MRWYICSTKGFEHTSRGNNAERAILGNPHSFRMAFFHVVLNWWMPLAFRVQAWHPYRWQHWAVNILDTTSRGADLKFAQTLLTLPIKSHCLYLISSSSLRSLEIKFPKCFTVSFQCRTVPFSDITGGVREPCLPENRIHTVFLALKIMSYSTLNSSHIFNIRLKLNTVGASKAMSSAEHKDPKYSWPMWQPTPLLSNLSNRTSI